MSLFNHFSTYNDGKGIKKDDVQNESTTSFVGFFKMYGRKFWGLSAVNMLFVLLNFPVFFLLFANSGYLDVFSQAPVSPLYAPLYGISLYGANPLVSTLLGALSANMTTSMHTVGTYVFYGLTLLLLLTFGPASAGLAAVLRNYTRGDPVFMMSDFFGTIKRNWFQSLVLGIIDLIVIGLFTYNIMFYSINGASLLMYITIALIIVYFCMRFYMYVILVTFKLSLFKILKNSFIFALVGFKRNLAAIFGIIITAAINWYAVMLYFPFGFLLPFLITASTMAFISIYAAYPNIKKYMVDPYYPDSSSSSNDTSAPIFVDRG